MLVVVDTGLGNAGSIVNMCTRLNLDVRRSAHADDIASASALILPGVGAFDAGMERLRTLQLLDPLNERVLQAGVPVLGICLGMQLMTRSSEEGTEAGLGWIDGTTRSLRSLATDPDVRLRLPHIGWNYIRIARNHPLTRNMQADTRFYFVHSFAVVCDSSDDVLMTASYQGIPFAAGFARENIVGMQFHPEKSHRFGMNFFRNFAAWVGLLK